MQTAGQVPVGSDKNREAVMKHEMATMASRRDLLSRLLLALAVALTLGTAMVPEVDATKKGKNTVESIKSRVKRQQKICESYGGTATVTPSAGKSKTVKCEG